MDKKEKREALKRLREERRSYIEKARALSKDVNREIKEIKNVLSSGPKTVPDIADSTKLPRDKVLYYVMALKKYGEVAEAEKDGSYFKYQLIEK